MHGTGGRSTQYSTHTGMRRIWESFSPTSTGSPKKRAATCWRTLDTTLAHHHDHCQRTTSPANLNIQTHSHPLKHQHPLDHRHRHRCHEPRPPTPPHARTCVRTYTKILPYRRYDYVGYSISRLRERRSPSEAGCIRSIDAAWTYLTTTASVSANNIGSFTSAPPPSPPPPPPPPPLLLCHCFFRRYGHRDGTTTVAAATTSVPP